MVSEESTRGALRIVRWFFESDHLNDRQPHHAKWIADCVANCLNSPQSLPVLRWLVETGRVDKPAVHRALEAWSFDRQIVCDMNKLGNLLESI